MRKVVGVVGAAFAMLVPAEASAQWDGSPNLEDGLNPDQVRLFEDFERDDFGDGWTTYWNEAPGPETVSDPAAYVFAGNRSLVVRGSSGEHYSEGGGEWAPYQDSGQGLDTAYARVYLRLEDDFILGSCNQLKLFGFKGGAEMDNTYGGAGEPPDGYDKMSVILSVDNDMAFHFYVYYPDQEDIWGDYMYLDVGGQATLEPGHWYQIELLVALNAPGQRNAQIRAWIDGELKGDVQGIRFRETGAVRIRRFEIENYFGGDGPENTSPRDQRAFYDNVVISTGPIGAYAGDGDDGGIGGGGDGDADGDSDSDADIDSDADTDADSDTGGGGGADGDSDADPGDGDSDPGGDTDGDSGLGGGNAAGLEQQPGLTAGCSTAGEGAGSMALAILFACLALVRRQRP